MAAINQDPLGQTSAAISIAPADGIGVGTVNPARRPVARTQNGGVGIAITIGSGSQIVTQTLISGALRGRNTSVSPTQASGLFTLDDQIAAKRADAWPS